MIHLNFGLRLKASQLGHYQNVRSTVSPLSFLQLCFKTYTLPSRCFILLLVFLKHGYNHSDLKPEEKMLPIPSTLNILWVFSLFLPYLVFIFTAGPEHPPTTGIGSFELFSKYRLRDVTIYWLKIPQYLQNGPNFHYKFSVFEDGVERRLVDNDRLLDFFERFFSMFFL